MIDSRLHGPGVLEIYKEKGRFHRLDGPAYTHRDLATGVVIAEIWYKNGVKSRDDGGPALTYRDAITGFPIRQQWWKDGRCVDWPAPEIANRFN